MKLKSMVELHPMVVEVPGSNLGWGQKLENKIQRYLVLRQTNFFFKMVGMFGALITHLCSFKTLCIFCINSFYKRFLCFLILLSSHKLSLYYSHFSLLYLCLFLRTFNMSVYFIKTNSSHTIFQRI